MHVIALFNRRMAIFMCALTSLWKSHRHIKVRMHPHTSTHMHTYKRTYKHTYAHIQRWVDDLRVQLTETRWTVVKLGTISVEKYCLVVKATYKCQSLSPN